MRWPRRMVSNPILQWIKRTNNAQNAHKAIGVARGGDVILVFVLHFDFGTNFTTARSYAAFHRHSPCDKIVPR